MVQVQGRQGIRVKLHEAMAEILQGRGWMSLDDLAQEIASRDLYQRKDGKHPEGSQLRWRARGSSGRYRTLFEVDGSRIRLLQPLSKWSNERKKRFNHSSRNTACGDQDSVFVVEPRRTNKHARASAAEETSPDSPTEQLKRLYRDIYSRYSPIDSELVPRSVVPRVFESRVMLIAQAPGSKTQRLSGFPYCSKRDGELVLSSGGRTLDNFLRHFGYTIDPNDVLRTYAYHTDIAHYYPGKKGQGYGDKLPSSEEIRHNRRWFARELELIEPLVVIALGKPAANEVRKLGGLPPTERLIDIPAQLTPINLLEQKAYFAAIHHPSGAFQHPTSSARYEQVAKHISRLLRR